MDPTEVTIISALAIFAGLFGFWWKLDNKIERLDAKLSGDVKDVRQASENSHKEIIGRQGAMQTTLATHTERFSTVQAQIKCVEDKVDNLSRSS